MPGGLIAAEAALDWHAQLGRSALAVSGGADSLALLLLMRRALERNDADPKTCTVYSVDHGLRPEAADEVAFVVATARGMGFVARGLRWEGEKPATGIQAAARLARYRLIAAAMREDDRVDLVTAHHMADQAETVLMRLAHGSGIEGLSGMHEMRFVEGCRVSRPLLGVHPGELRAIVADAGLTPVDDPSNADPHYERARWRQFQPQLDRMGLTIERLALFAERASLAADLVNDVADAAYPELVTPTASGAELPHGRFSVLNPLVGVTLLRDVLTVVSGDRSPVPLGALEELQQALAPFEKLAGRTLHGCIVRSNGKTITIRREGPRRRGRGASADATAG